MKHDWGAKGHEFKSRRSDQFLRENPIESRVLCVSRNSSFVKHSVFHDGGGGHNGGHKSRMLFVSSFIFKAFRHFALWEVVDKVVDTP